MFNKYLFYFSKKGCQSLRPIIVCFPSVSVETGGGGGMGQGLPNNF